MQKKESSQTAVTVNEEVNKIKATTMVSSDELSTLSNEQIALRLYFLVANGTNKQFSDFYDIGNHFNNIAANLKC
ncbi:hypothetical protein MHH70_12360 [Metasolibacillus sp. FSL H7-0170]|uniref:hypothetical protein n=1 Tax=Metasolibacillus sp. FSL H7-0170 TaxID=2921431 RepID=UPI003158A0D4